MKKLNRFLLKLQRITYPFFHRSNPVFKKKNYFLNQFLEKTKGYNIKAIDFSEGLTTGNFNGKNYLINFKPGDFMESTIYTDGCWERHITPLISHALNKSSGIMLDIGANIGLNTIPLAIEHSNIKFYCYEPHPVLFHRLENNIKLNKLNNVSAINCALSDSKEDNLTFYAQKNSPNMGLSSLRLNPDIEEYYEITTPINAIDKLFKDSSETVSVIKIDTQGEETAIIKSAIQTIERNRPVVFFEFEDAYYSDDDRESSKKFLESFFKQMNYSLFNITSGINYYPKIDIRQEYKGDILAMPN